MIAPNARPNKAAVRAALLSARLYDDTLGDKSMLRYAGFGVLEPERAFDILRRDSEAPNPYVPWLSLYRLGLAYGQTYGQTFRAASDEWLEPIASKAVELGAQAARSSDPGALNLLTAPTGTANSRAPLTNARNWKTTVTPNSDGSTTVVVEMEVRAPFLRLALMCDPRQWQNVSLFWYESTAVDGAPPGNPPSINDPDAQPQPWSGTLQEKVAGMGVLTVLLHVDYKVELSSNVCTVDYQFIRSPDSSLCLDNGRMIVEPREDGWFYTYIDKKIDFGRALFGGLSSADLLAPSFIGTWMRVQQDFWAAYATGWQQPADASHSS